MGFDVSLARILLNRRSIGMWQEVGDRGAVETNSEIDWIHSSFVKQSQIPSQATIINLS